MTDLRIPAESSGDIHRLDELLAEPDPVGLVEYASVEYVGRHRAPEGKALDDE